MAILTVQPLVKSGSLNPAFVAAAGGGDSFANDGKTLLYVKNAGGAPINVTIAPAIASVDAGADIGPVALSNLVVSVTNAQERVIGPFPARAFNDVNGRVPVTYSGVTSVTVAAMRMPA